MTGTLTARAGQRLLDEIEAIGLERANGLECRRAVPALVRVDAERDLRPDRLAEPAHARHVVPYRMRGGLDLEDAMTARDLLARFRDLGVQALHRERPRQRHALAHAPAEQPVDGHAERAAVQVPERHLDRGARERVTLHAPGHLAAQRLDAGRVAPDEPRRDVALDRDGDRLRRFLAPRRTAQTRGLAPADEAVGGLEADEGEVDRLERREGHLVRALDRNVGEDDADVGELHRITTG